MKERQNQNFSLLKQKKTVYHKLKEHTMQYNSTQMQQNSIQKKSENYSMFSLNKWLTQSPLILSNSLVGTHIPENKSVFCH